jgi:hypothetical protein
MYCEASKLPLQVERLHSSSCEDKGRRRSGASGQALSRMYMKSDLGIHFNPTSSSILLNDSRPINTEQDSHSHTMTRNVPPQPSDQSSNQSGGWSFQGTHIVKATGTVPGSDQETENIWSVPPGEKLSFDVKPTVIWARSRREKEWHSVPMKGAVFSVDGGPPESLVPLSVKVSQDNDLTYEQRIE